MKFENLKFWRKNRAQKEAYRTPYDEARFVIVKADGSFDVGQAVQYTRLPWWQRVVNRLPLFPRRMKFRQHVTTLNPGKPIGIPLGIVLDVAPDQFDPINTLYVMTKGTIKFRTEDADGE